MSQDEHDGLQGAESGLAYGLARSALRRAWTLTRLFGLKDEPRLQLHRWALLTVSATEINSHLSQSLLLDVALSFSTTNPVREQVIGLLIDLFLILGLIIISLKRIEMLQGTSLRNHESCL